MITHPCYRNADQGTEVSGTPEAPLMPQSLGSRVTILLTSVTEVGVPTVAPFLWGLHASRRCRRCRPGRSLLSSICPALLFASWPLSARGELRPLL